MTSCGLGARMAETRIRDKRRKHRPFDEKTRGNYREDIRDVLPVHLEL